MRKFRFNFKKIKDKIMAFFDIFKDENDFNEKSIIGFISFAIMTIFALTDLITGIIGYEIAIHEYIYESFMIITLGSFGISELGKLLNKAK
jgi:hypothetical protein